MGKSTLARRLSTRLALPYVEMDSLYHGPHWTPRPSFAEDVRQLVAGDRWVVEFAYDEGRAQVLPRCDLMVSLELPRWLAMWQATSRTLRRRLTRQQLWNGNREGPLWRILIDDEHIIRWAWKTHPEAAERIERIARERPDLPIVRLRSRREIARWIDSLPLSAGGMPEPPR